jgi:hypothetical protein
MIYTVIYMILFYYLILFVFLTLFAVSVHCIEEGLMIKYNAEDTDTPYHIDYQLDPLSGTWLLNRGTLQYVPWTRIKDKYTYNDETYKYGATSYVPSYTDSVYLGIVKNEK